MAVQSCDPVFPRLGTVPSHGTDLPSQKSPLPAGKAADLVGFRMFQVYLRAKLEPNENRNPMALPSKSHENMGVSQYVPPVAAWHFHAWPLLKVFHGRKLVSRQISIIPSLHVFHGQNFRVSNSGRIMIDPY